MELHLTELINPKPKDTRSGIEIFDDIVSRAGIEVIS